MGRQIVAKLAGNDGDVGLGLRQPVESDRLLLTDVASASEGLLECRVHETDHGGVTLSLRLPHDEQAVEQLDPVFWTEHAVSTRRS